MFLLPVRVLRTAFRKKFLSGLCQLYRKGLLNLRGPAAPLRDPACFEQLISKLGNKKWYVYAKPPFGGPEQILNMVGFNAFPLYSGSDAVDRPYKNPMTCSSAML